MKFKTPVFTNIQDYIQSLTDEETQDYYQLMFELIDLINPDMSQEDVVACMCVLKQCVVLLSDGLEIGIDNDNWLTLREIAAGMGVKFHLIHTHYAVWYGLYWEKRGESQVNERVDEFISRLMQSPKVKSVIKLI